MVYQSNHEKNADQKVISGNLNALIVIEIIAITGCLIVLSMFFVEYVLL
jgi:hypothetical protein